MGEADNMVWLERWGEVEIKKIDTESIGSSEKLKLEAASKNVCLASTIQQQHRLLWGGGLQRGDNLIYLQPAIEEVEHDF